MHSNGPFSGCISTYIKLFERNQTHQEDPELIQHLGKLPLYNLLCDEIEEAMGGDAVLSGHWKRRDTSFYNDLIVLAKHLREPELVEWMEDAKDMSHGIHHSNPKSYFPELRPPNNKTLLFNTAEFNPAADPRDTSRWKAMVDITRTEQALVQPYLKSKSLPTVREGSIATKRACTHFANGELSMEGYFQEFDKMMDKALACEKRDPRFKHKVPLPDKPPAWAYYHS
jgi:hypothetical protein